jgi:hypothetical protein
MNRRRRYDAAALGAGFVFIVLGVLFLLDQLDVITLRAGYVLPVVLIAIGAGMLVRALLASRRR